MGSLSAYASTFLVVVAVGTLVLFGLPMLIAPLRWARVLGWDMPSPVDLAVYFGRSLGAVVCVLGAGAFVAAYEPTVTRFYFTLLLGCVGAMLFVHVWGAVRRIQPRAETWEILYWAALFLLALAFCPPS